MVTKKLGIEKSQRVFTGFDADVSAYLSKEGNRTTLIDTLRKIKGGKKSISLKLTEAFANQIDDTSDRELKVMKHIALGKTVKLRKSFFLVLTQQILTAPGYKKKWA